MAVDKIYDFPLIMGGEKDSGVAVFDLKTLIETNSLVRGRPYRVPCYMLLLITAGQGQHRLDSESWSYQAGTLFSIAAGQVQVFDWPPDTAGYQILFTDTYCASHSSDLSWFYRMPFFDPTNKASVFQLSPSGYRAAAWVTRRLHGLVVSETDPLGRQLQWHLLKMLLLEIENERVSAGQYPPHGCGEAALYGRFREKLERDFRQCRCVRTYAKSLHVTPKKLNQVVQRQVGRPVKQVIDERVIVEIQRLLMHTDLTIQEIGYQLGFAEPGYIIKFFKRHMTCTPTQYKLAHRAMDLAESDRK